MNRKRTAAQPDESDPITEQQLSELKAELAGANDQLAALGGQKFSFKPKE